MARWETGTILSGTIHESQAPKARRLFKPDKGNMKCVLGIAITLAVLGVGALLFAWSGIYNIAATKPLGYHALLHRDAS